MTAKTRKALLAPSILSADFSRLGEEVKTVEEGGADWIHVDVMDGHFVPNLTIGPLIVEAVRPLTHLPLDCHLMVSKPEEWVEPFAKAGANSITVHAEATVHLDRLLRQIRDLGCHAGVSINPATPLEMIDEVLDLVDLVLIMSVNPGFGGQKFIEGSVSKIQRLSELRGPRRFLIEVDGGIKAANIGTLYQAGADVFVAGSAIFDASDRKKSDHRIEDRSSLMESFKLGAKPLKLEEIQEIALGSRRVELSPVAIRRIEKSRRYLLGEIKKGKTLYGVNTGFGLLSNVKIPESDIETLQYNLLRSHAVGTGAYLSDAQSRAMLVLRAQSLAQGHSGVSLGLVEQILKLLNRGVCPMVPEQGSVGASGDLAPLSHLALNLIGEGRARYKGKEMSAAQALKAAGIKPIRLGPKEGIALINGTQFMTGVGTLAFLEAEHLCDIADLAGSMTIEALRGTEAAFEPEIHRVRPHPGQIAVAKNIRKLLLSGGGKSEIALSHENCGRVQDPYSLRCIPQVHGATRDSLRFVRQVLETEVNSVTDNPLVFVEEKKILSGGNFHGQIVAIAMDLLAIASAELASISEERLAKLVNPAISELPAFLTKNSGLNSGFMIVQVAAASLVSENKTLCHPASVDSIPTSADKEDHVSMGAWAARKARQVVRNARRVLAMELLGGAQGIDLLRPLRSSKAIETAHRAIRKRVAYLDQDRAFHEDILVIENLIESQELDQIFSSAVKGH